ncbi:MAG: tRNA lysidine(34) synthetase TilS [Ignavibacteriales bacterium]|nr:tRNA lysidine(34) synthetase TilS [Ignavibacteriales bacterium]
MEQQKLFKSFQQFITRNRLVKRGEKIIVSVSGGIDSMVLLYLFMELSKRMKLTIATAHFNHQLRGKESDEDEMFVREIARKLKLRCFIESADTFAVSQSEKKSIQETARDLRYSFLSAVRNKLDYNKIATAHNADDNSETILFNIFRGTGVHGMTGIPVFRRDQNIIRPLIFASREDITNYASELSIKYREDSSNKKSDYTRNYIRINLLPIIRENLNPNIRNTLLRTAHLFSGLEEHLDSETEIIKRKVIKSITKDKIVYSRSNFLNQSRFIQEQLIYLTARELCETEIDYTAVTSMLKIFESQSGSYITVNSDIIISRDRDEVILQRWKHPGAFIYPVKLNGTNRFPNFSLDASQTKRKVFTSDKNIELIDTDRLGKDIHVRSWHDGDWFIPLGMKERKKLSDYFIDQKISIFKKHTIPVLESDGNIVWVCGMRLDDRFKVTKSTKNIIKLELKMNKKKSK